LLQISLSPKSQKQVISEKFAPALSQAGMTFVAKKRKAASLRLFGSG
jgi:hypothetical protein